MSCRFLMRNAAATALPVGPFALGWCAAALLSSRGLGTHCYLLAVAPFTWPNQSCIRTERCGSTPPEWSGSFGTHHGRRGPYRAWDAGVGGNPIPH